MPIHVQMADYLLDQYFSTKDDSEKNKQVLTKIKDFASKLLSDNVLHPDIALDMLAQISNDQLNIQGILEEDQDLQKTIFHEIL